MPGGTYADGRRRKIFKNGAIRRKEKINLRKNYTNTMIKNTYTHVAILGPIIKKLIIPNFNFIFVYFSKLRFLHVIN